jgi:uncharacterized protein
MIMQKTAVLLVAIALQTAASFAYVSPGQPTGYVNDFSGVLSGEIKSNLEQKLVQFHTDTSNEVVVVLVPSIGNDYIESYTLSLAQDWKIADAKKDNAVILLLATNDRKVRIEVGYGLEGALPDSVANSIIREMVPSLKSDDYEGAVSAGVEKIISATKNEYVASPTNKSSGNGGLLEILLFCGLFALQWLASVLGRSKAWWPGGAIGFVGASVFALLGLLSLSLVAYAALILIATFFGAFFDYIVSNTYQHDQRLGVNHPWWIGGGSSGSGGFGGFGGGGGGSFGGGGSSGSW